MLRPGYTHMTEPNKGPSLKILLFGRARSLADRDLFHNLSLVALLAWVGLGADGLSSSCYGPPESFKVLGANPHLSVFVAFACVLTILAICASYSQIISLFPTGGGGYLVASKLLSPAAGVVSGCALLIDYVLTVTISVASGADAFFSLLPESWAGWKLAVAVTGVIGLTLLNMRGVKESVMVLLPIFGIFILTHAVVVFYPIVFHASALGGAFGATIGEVHAVSSQVGWVGLIAILLKSYSMGAGTYTGIEAVSNGLPILREPRVRTGRRTMVYMGTSLAITVAGLLLAYVLYAVGPEPGKTLNAVLCERMSAHWPAALSKPFILVTLASEAALLIVAAQTGFLGGPRVMSNLALDRWFPTQFSNLSDRLVTQNGVVLMGAAALLVMVITKGSVEVLVVLYSINVFITFSLSQLGMVVHWWQERRTEPAWLRRIAVAGFGLTLTVFILVSLTVVKFFEGGWATLLVTALLVAASFAIKRHYLAVGEELKRLDVIVEAANLETTSRTPAADEIDPKARTAIILVNGYNGLGLHTVLQVTRVFGDSFRNFVFILVGAVDAGNFKGAAEIDALRAHTTEGAERYVAWLRARGYGADAYTSVSADVMGEVMALAQQAADRYPNLVFFAGQLLFTYETLTNRLLHNHTAFSLQRRFFLANLPFVILPIRVDWQRAS